uniref:Uncharacterized protein n=1 Tax=Tanacetum cinerariifolium TaxID=118510 RepID=A0A699HNY5_TANCI|nr:hypothetical protein [Tanacetum cinerariifolium]
MSTPSHIDSETISQTNEAQSSRVPIPSLDDPYMAVRHVYLANIMGFMSEPFEDSKEIEIPQPLPIASSPVPLSDYPYLIVGQTHTPAAIDTKSELEEAPLKTEELQPLATRTSLPSLDDTTASSDLTPVSHLTNEEFKASEPSDTRITSSHSIDPSYSTTPLSPNHTLTQTSPTPTRVSYYCSTARMTVRTQPTLSLGLLAQITEATALSPSSFYKRHRSSYETPSPSSSLTLPILKRYRGTSELVEDAKDESLYSDTKREGLEDEGPGIEEAAPEGQQHTVSVMDKTTDEPLGLGYGALRRHELRVEETPAPTPSVQATWVDHVDGTVYIDILIYVPPVYVHVQTPPSPKWSSGSLPVSSSCLAVPTPVASPADSSPIASPPMVEDENFLAELEA